MDGRLVVTDDSGVRLLTFELVRLWMSGRLIVFGETVLGLELTLLEDVRGRGV